ncbi:mitochondrial phosphate carrier protein [Protomyces lactucae-debilis]|uniref:Mitochondrial phosphate carrier protein n=1 Tax=Protomyces lactucae-debilis TaxID=2754530 RepID=A0A1Y2FF15_PROLT|nr:mitochondrial phosphate carrier protein [Protomyces lactucae-debilis]ORY81994.1 mitochondrial phosphate carrier protein [Protomyces lactucae-debilis]
MATTPQFSLSDYSKFFSAGALCCTLTHGATTPIDVVKTRIQVDSALKGSGMLAAARSIVAAEGPAVLLTGFGATAAGYLVQGGAKFAGYEFFKKTFIDLAGGPEAAMSSRTAIYLGASSAAEFFADVLLCSLEATRIRLVSERGFATGLLPGFARIAREEGLKGFYSGFIPLLCKQVPYAVGQFTTHEWLNEAIFKAIGEERKAKLSHAESTLVELTSGIGAGVVAAVLSHPADTLLSKINKGKGGDGSAVHKLGVLARETGFRGLWAGLGPRILMTSFLVSGQFVLYAQIKTALGSPPGIEIHAA